MNNDARNTNTSTQLYLNEIEASNMLGLSVHFLRQQRCKRPANMIPYSKIGKRVLYSHHDLVMYMETRKITAHYPKE